MQQNAKTHLAVTTLPAPSGPHNLARDVMDSMEQGVIVWDADGLCELVNVRVYEVLELKADELYPGMQRVDFLQLGVARGEFPQQVADQAGARFNEGEPFSFERSMPSGRSIITSVRPRASGGFVVTFSDITILKENELAVSEARDRAESAETELSKQLQNLTNEKAMLEKQQKQLSRLSMVAMHAKDIIAITTASGDIEWVNDAFSDSLGYKLDDLIARSYLETISGKDTDPQSIEEISNSILNRQVVKVEMLCYQQNNQSFWMELEVTPVFSSKGKHTHFVAVGRNTTRRKIADQKAGESRKFELRKRQEAKLLAEFNEWLQSTDSLVELFPVVSSFLSQLLPNSSGAVYVYANSRDVLDGVCNWNDGKMLTNFEPPDCWALRRGRSYYYGENVVDFPCRHIAKSHTETAPERHYCLPIIAHGDTVGLLCIELPHCTDPDASVETQKLANFCAEQISLAIANVQLREQLTDQSTRDALTSLFNRRYFVECMRRELSRCAETEHVSVISFDVDNFKKFNDTFGHDAGDSVLRAMSDVLTEMFTGSEIPCRYGGEEFAVLLPGTNTEQACEKAEALRLAVKETVVRYSGDELAVTISSGVSTYPENGLTVQTLIKSADQALYAAKDSGRNNTKHINDLESKSS